MSLIPHQHLLRCGNITSYIYTVTQLHLNGSQCIAYFFTVFTFNEVKTYKVFFSSCFCTTTGSMVLCSYNSTAMISEFINTGDNACCLSSSIIKNYGSLTTLPSWNHGTLTVNTSWHFDNFKVQLIETISDMDYNYFSQNYSKCTNTYTIQTNCIKHPTELIILLKLKVVE